LFINPVEDGTSFPDDCVHGSGMKRLPGGYCPAVRSLRDEQKAALKAIVVEAAATLQPLEDSKKSTIQHSRERCGECSGGEKQQLCYTVFCNSVSTAKLKAEMV